MCCVFVLFPLRLYGGTELQRCCFLGFFVCRSAAIVLAEPFLQGHSVT